MKNKKKIYSQLINPVIFLLWIVVVFYDYPKLINPENKIHLFLVIIMTIIIGIKAIADIVQLRKNLKSGNASQP